MLVLVLVLGSAVWPLARLVERTRLLLHGRSVDRYCTSHPKYASPTRCPSHCTPNTDTNTDADADAYLHTDLHTNPSSHCVRAPCIIARRRTLSHLFRRLLGLSIR